MKIFVKKIEGVTLPEKGSEVAAGYDIVATSEPKIVGVQSSIPNTWSQIEYIEYETNLFTAPELKTFHTLIHPRSSISKYNLVLANSIGLVDNDYRGMIICRFKYCIQPQDLIFTTNANGSIECVVSPNKIYKKGDKIAQLVIEQTVQAEWVFVDELNQTQRGEGGFGSTDKLPSNTSNKSVAEVFEEEKKKFETKRNQSVSPILDKYKEVGGIPVKIPYSEQMKEKLREY